MKTLERITGSEARQWKKLTDRLRPGKAFLVENHGQAEAVIVHPADFSAEPFDLDKHFARVRASKPLPMPDWKRGPEL